MRLIRGRSNQKNNLYGGVLAMGYEYTLGKAESFWNVYNNALSTLDAVSHACKCKSGVRAWTKETDSAYVIYFAVPGIKAEDFSLEFDKTASSLDVTIKAQRSLSTGETVEKCTTDTVNYDVSKTVLFDKEVDPETTTAKYRQDGILEIVVPFSKSVASRKVIVQ